MPISLMHRTNYTLSVPTKLSIAALFLALSFAAFDTVWTIHLDSIVNNASLVGFISSAMTMVAMLLFIFLTPLIIRYPEKRLWVISAIGLAVSYFFLFISWTLALFLIASFAFIALKVLHYEVRGLLIRDSCKKKEIGKVQGLFGALRNVGWLLGPIIGGFVATKLGNPSVFLFSCLFALIGYAIFKLIKIKDINHKTNDECTLKSSLKNIKDFFKTKKLLKSYLVSGCVPLYWSVIYTFVPLYIIRNGLEMYYVGYFLFAIAFPLILLEMKIGELADKHGYRKFFILGYLLMALFPVLAFFSTNIYLVLILLVLGSFGTSLVEATRESYFFSQVSQSKEEKYYGPYMTHINAFSTIGKILAAILLIFFSLKSVFLLLGIEMLAFAFISTIVKDKVSRKKTISAKV